MHPRCLCFPLYHQSWVTHHWELWVIQVCPSVYLSTCSSACQSIYLYAYMSDCMSTSLCVCMFSAYLSVSLSVHPSVCMYVWLSVYLSWNFSSHSIVFYFILDIHVTLVLRFIHVCILQQRKLFFFINIFRCNLYILSALSYHDGFNITLLLLAHAWSIFLQLSYPLFAIFHLFTVVWRLFVAAVWPCLTLVCL